MNIVFNQVESKMIEEMMKKKYLTDKRYSDKKEYLRALVKRLYLSL